MVNSYTLSFTVPQHLKMTLDIITKTGYYDSVSEFLRDAIRTTLQEKKDLRICIAYELYKAEYISLGKAAEIIQTTPEKAAALFKERD